MSTATPVTPAARSPYVFLLTDPWIGLSWLLLIGSGLLSVMLLQNAPAAAQGHATTRAEVTAVRAMTCFLTTGYFFWSSYFGLAACWRFMMGRVSAVGSVWMAFGCMFVILVGWIAFAAGLLYGVLGGGIYQFLRRWWLLAHGQRPPFLRARRVVRW
jgi:hypothetical protein